MNADAAKADEPAEGGDDSSMEDILHSIRDIIADDKEKEDETPTMAEEEKKEEVAAEEPAAEAKPEEETVPAEDDDEILELTEKVGGDEAPAEGEEGDAAASGDVLDDIDEALGQPEEEKAEAEAPAEESPTPPETEPAPSPAPEEAPPPPPVAEETPASAEKKPGSLVSDKTAQSSADALKSLVNSVPRPEVDEVPLRGGNTLEDLVIEALKPMLSEWLDNNLSVLVEELVQKEIKKLLPRD